VSNELDEGGFSRNNTFNESDGFVHLGGVEFVGFLEYSESGDFSFSGSGKDSDEVVRFSEDFSGEGQVSGGSVLLVGTSVEGELSLFEGTGGISDFLGSEFEFSGSFGLGSSSQ